MMGIFLFLILGLGVSLKDKGIGSSEVAGWVQAVGAIAAIVGTALYMDAQNRTDRQLVIDAEIRAKSRYQDSILAITKAVAAAVEKIPSAADLSIDGKTSVAIRYDSRVLAGLVDALGAIAVHELGSAEAVTAFLAIRNGAIRIQVAVESFSAQEIPREQSLYPDARPDANLALKIGGKKARLAESLATLERIFSS